VPKSIKVSKLQSSSFKKTLSFNRIKNYFYEADFNKVFTINTKNNKPIINQFQSDINKSILELKNEIKIPNYSIVMLGSQDSLNILIQMVKDLINIQDGIYVMDVTVHLI
jgi:hypothetical protein